MEMTTVAKNKKPARETELGTLLRAKRAADDLNVRDVAELIDLSISGVSELENGKRTPEMDTIVNIHEGLKIPLEDLLRAVAKDKGVEIPERTDQGIVTALNDRAAAFPDLWKILRRLERTDPAQYHLLVRMLQVFEQDDEPPP